MLRPLAILLLVTGPASAVGPPAAIDPALASRARAVLEAHCHRCHGQDGAVEGGLNYVLDRDKLVARRKVVPGDPDHSPVYTRTHSGKMPPKSEKVRPSEEEIAVLRKWIEAGAPGKATSPIAFVPDAVVQEWMLADLDRLDRRARRFVRYFSLVPLANAGAGEDELKTYRNALGKLLNSLSWHPRITLPHAIDPRGLVMRIDLRDYLLDANLWNRLLNDYPYGVLHDTGVSRAVVIGTASRMPVVRADWFVATASRAPLYYDLLQIPGNLAELERQLRVDVTANIQQERVARAGFNGSGVSRNNRILERHDAMNGAYWRTYDFEAVPQNLIERNLLLPDRRNVFAYPLGPGGAETQFQHAGGEVIFNLPNGLQGYVLVNASNQRVNKGPTEIVSDPKRPDRAVEAGLSCIHCHARGINPKDDQLREHVAKNKKAFARLDRELVEALHPPVKKMRQLMEEDAQRFEQAVARTGNKTTAAEVILAMTLRYEGDVDLPTLAAEVGVTMEELQPRLSASENLTKNLGPLKVPGGTVSRQVVVQAFADLVRELRLGTVLEVGRGGETLPDATGEVDPLEAQSSPANAVAFSPDRKLAAFASNDRSVRIYDIEAGRELRRGIGHTASVWSVAFSPDGTRLLSGSKDGTVRLWDVETGRELAKLEGHVDLVSAVAFAPDGRRAASAGFDQEVILWDLVKQQRLETFRSPAGVRYPQSIAWTPDGRHIVVAAERTILRLDLTGAVVSRLEGHTGWVNQVTTDGKRVASASDDGTARLWDIETGKLIQTYRGHGGAVKSVGLSKNGSPLLTGGADATVRLWDAAAGRELRAFRKHQDSVVAVTFTAADAATLSGSRDAVVQPWRLGKVEVTPPDRPKATDDLALAPLARIPVGGTIGQLLLAPDRGSLYYLNRTAGLVGRLDLASLERPTTLDVPDAEALALSPDGKSLVALQSTARATRLDVIDPVKLTLRKRHTLKRGTYDVAVSDAGVAALSGRDAEWSEVTWVNLGSGEVIDSWSNVWGKSLVQLSPDGRRLFVSSQGVVPGTLEAFAVPERVARGGFPGPTRPAGGEKLNLGGGFVVAPDGRHLVLKTGTVVGLDADLTSPTRIEPHLACAIDADGKRAYVLRREGGLSVYSYPEFRLLSRPRLGFAAYACAVDGTGRKLYVAGFDPRGVADQPRARGHGDIHVYSLEAVR